MLFSSLWNSDNPTTAKVKVQIASILILILLHRKKLYWTQQSKITSNKHHLIVVLMMMMNRVRHAKPKEQLNLNNNL